MNICADIKNQVDIKQEPDIDDSQFNQIKSEIEIFKTEIVENGKLSHITLIKREVDFDESSVVLEDKKRKKRKKKNGIKVLEQHQTKTSSQQSAPTNSTWFHCNQCTFKSAYKKNVTRHANIHTKEFSCKFCNKPYGNKRCLDYHLLNKHREQANRTNITYTSYECTKCIKTFPSKLRYDTHLFNKHQQEVDMSEIVTNIYECSKCKRSFSCKFNYENHLLGKHRGDYPTIGEITREIQQCSICGYETISKYRLKMHLLNHKGATGKDQFSCNECQYTTYNKNTLKRHLLTHTICNEKTQMHLLNDMEQFSCNQCQFTTLYKNNLKRHLIIHAKTCTICNVDFNDKTEKDSHILVYHSKNAGLVEMITSKIYECPQCSYKSVYPENVDSHRLEHDNVKSEPV